MSFDSKNLVIFTVATFLLIINTSFAYRLWDNVTTLTSDTGGIEAVAVDNDYVYFGGVNGTVNVVARNSTWNNVTVLTPTDMNVNSIAVDNDYVYIGCSDWNFYVVARNSTWNNVTNLTLTNGGSIYSIVPDNDVIYVGGYDSIVHVINKNTWNNYYNITVASDQIESIVIDEQYIYIGTRSSDKKVYVVAKNSTFDNIATISVASSSVLSIDVDDNYLYIGSALTDKKVYVVAKNIWTNITNLTVSTQAVRSVLVDNYYVYIGSDDYKTYVISKNSTWNNITTLTPAIGSSKSLAVDSDYLYIGSYDNNVYVVKTGDMISPNWSNNKTSPSSPASNSTAQAYQFNITWSDTTGLDTVLIEHNFTGSTTPHNTSFTGNNSNEYYFNTSSLAVGTYVWRSFANDTLGNQNLTNQWNYVVQTTTTTTIPATTTTTLSSSGGGGGGGGTTTQTNSYTASVSQATSTKPANVTLTKTKSDEIGIKEVIIEVNNSVNNIRITVTKLNSKPASVKHEISGKLYNYIEITKSNLQDSSIQRGKIMFQVNKTWINQNKIDKEKIVLNRYVSTGWEKLSTSKINEDNSYVYYEAETKGFSVFAITGEEIQVSTTTTTIGSVISTTTTVPNEVTTTTVSGGTTEGETSKYLIYIVAVVLIVIIGFFVIKKISGKK